MSCDPYKYNLHHKNITGLELDALSFPVEEYKRRDEVVINAFDDFHKQSKGTIIPVRLTAAFCQRHDIEACVVIENHVPLYLDDDHISSAGADIVVEHIFKALERGN